MHLFRLCDGLWFSDKIGLWQTLWLLLHGGLCSLWWALASGPFWIWLKALSLWWSWGCPHQRGRQWMLSHTEPAPTPHRQWTTWRCVATTLNYCLMRQQEKCRRLVSKHVSSILSFFMLVWLFATTQPNLVSAATLSMFLTFTFYIRDVRKSHNPRKIQ